MRISSDGKGSYPRTGSRVVPEGELWKSSAPRKDWSRLSDKFEEYLGYF